MHIKDNNNSPHVKFHRFLFPFSSKFLDLNFAPYWGARNGAVVRALASHQCGPGSNPIVDAICELSLLFVLSFGPRGFSPGTPVFPFPKTNIFKFQFHQESGRRTTTLWMCYLQIIIYFPLFIYLLFICSLYLLM